MRRAVASTAAPVRTLLWRRHVSLLSGSHTALLARSATLLRAPRLASSTARGFASLPDGVEELTMPALSPTMTVGTISSWLKKEGEELQPGDVLCQIETDKAVVDYEMQDDAVLAHIVLPDGTADIPVGSVLAYTVLDVDTYKSLVDSGELEKLKDAPSKSKSTESSSAAAAKDSKAKDSDSKADASSSAESESHHREPLIKFLGKRSLLKESAAPKQDAAPAKSAQSASAASASAPTPASSTKASTSSSPDASTASDNNKSDGGDAFTDVALSNMRKIIAKRLAGSKHDVPHHYASIDCEIDRVMALRQELKAKHSVRVSLNDFLLKAVALALRDVPEANCHFDDQRNAVKRNDGVDIAVAVATAAGLITPIVPRVDALGLSGVNEKFMELVGRARDNRLKPEEFQGGSFTISNLGGFGVDSFTAVINQPSACIMAIGRGRKEVLPPLDLEDDEFASPRIATLLNVTLSADRRVVDDVIAGQFLQVFKRYMEHPELLLL